MAVELADEDFRDRATITDLGNDAVVAVREDRSILLQGDEVGGNAPSPLMIFICYLDRCRLAASGSKFQPPANAC
jgi:hypothetical protein